MQQQGNQSIHTISSVLSVSSVILLIVGVVVLFVMSMIGFGKVSWLVWSIPTDGKVTLGDEEYTISSFDVNLMRMFIVLSVINLIVQGIKAGSEATQK